MRCRFVKEIFHNKENGFCIFVYHTESAEVPEAAKDTHYKGKGARFTAIGTGLPDTAATETELSGSWVKSRYGLQLQVESYQEILPQTKEGIRGYLSSGMIKGIGPKTAELIVERFGTRTFDVLDHYPDSLLEVRGITRKKLDAILLSYQGSHAMRDLAAYLAPFKVTPRKIQKIYEEFGNDALDTVKNQPFALCRISGFGFLTVDEIAKANRGKPDDPMRIEGCIRYCMEQGMQEGHLYQDRQLFQKKVHGQLNKGYQGEAVTEAAVYRVLYQMVKEERMYYESGALYPADMYGYECGAARNLASLLLADREAQDITSLLAEAQEELGISLSPKQEEAVRKAFRHPVSIITGGPGTGKTTVQKALLHVHDKLGGGSVLLTAPTGRASRRMAESTGRQEAMTMHSALGLTSDEDSGEMEGMLEAGLIIADEFTMSDMRLSHIFFAHIRAGSRLVLVGDVDQLPSVGPGNVFRELVQCGVIPVTVLDTIFRQAEGSRIIANAKRMQENDAALDYGAGFAFIPAGSAAEAADKVLELYRASVDALGMDPEVTEAPFDAQMLAGMGGAQPDAADAIREFQENTAGDAEALQEEPFPGQHGIEEYIPMPEEVGQAMGMANAMEQQGAALSAMGQMPQGTADASVQDSRAQQARRPVQPTQQAAPSMQERRPAQGMPPAMQNAQAAAPTGRNPSSAGTGQAALGRAQKPAHGGAPSMSAGSTPAQRAGKGSGQGADGIRKDMPVEQIYSLLDRDRAAAVVIPMGFNRGKTLGQLAVEKPANLQWYVDSYGGPDNLLRAAAKFLIDTALGQAG